MMDGQSLSQERVFGFDARGVAKRFRHASIFGALESLGDGDTMRFVNDHDPLPLLDQIRARYGDQVGIRYQSRDTGNIVIDFTIQLSAVAESEATQTGGCGGGAGGCGCSGR